MGDDPLGEALRAVQEALGPPPAGQFCPPVPLPTVPSSRRGVQPESSAGEGSLRSAELGGDGHEVAGPCVDGPSSGGPVWTAIHSLKTLLSLVPESRGGVTRLGQCVTIMRASTEQDLFPDAAPDLPASDSVRPITYPRIELNELIDSARPAILALLGSVDIERGVRDRLDRELKKKSQYIEPDDRGTIGGKIEPSGMTGEKQRNNARLDALATFLFALGRQPYAAVRYASTVLSGVAVPPDMLSAQLGDSTVTFRSKVYPVSAETARFVHMLVEARGGLVTGGAVKRAMGLTGQLRSDRLKEKLPEELLAAIITTNKGSRLDEDRLLSYA